MISTSEVIWQREGCALTDRQAAHLHAVASRDDRNQPPQYQALPIAMFGQVHEAQLDNDRSLYFGMTVLNCGHTVNYRMNSDLLLRQLNQHPAFPLDCPHCRKPVA